MNSQKPWAQILFIVIDLILKWDYRKDLDNQERKWSVCKIIKTKSLYIEQLRENTCMQSY